MAATTRGKRRREESAKEEISPASSELPPEIIREILLRLPAKSIGRFRCVAKLFCSLSSDPGFAKSHLDLTVHRKLIVSAYNLYALDFDGIGEGVTDLVAVELNYPLKEVPSKYDEIIQRIIRERGVLGCRSVVSDEMMKLNTELYRRNWVQFIGYSNGLVCMSPADNVFFLYNPTTRDSKRLPDLARVEAHETHGFGFDDLTNDYKVVKLVADTHRVVGASVYSLKTNSWRRICDLNYKRDFEGFVAGMNVNGAVHWVFTRQEANKRVVLAFDVKTEEFREMPLPGEAEDVSRNFLVNDLSGRLCVVDICFQEHDDIWVMNEYGVASSWSRIRIRLLFTCLRPLCSTKNNDEVLMEDDDDIVLYNFKTDAWRKLRIRGANLRGGFETHSYIESLISPNLYVVEN
ncbi:F-box domain-containing protein [Hirschfeldia incana]|nr:F-box domain-containing protein [Hirschfeldia incana]